MTKEVSCGMPFIQSAKTGKQSKQVEVRVETILGRLVPRREQEEGLRGIHTVMTCDCVYISIF